LLQSPIAVLVSQPLLLFTSLTPLWLIWPISRITQFFP